MRKVFFDCNVTPHSRLARKLSGPIKMALVKLNAKHSSRSKHAGSFL